jgi:hypothetical protein
MNFQTFRDQSIQLNKVMGASSTPEQQAQDLALLYETLETLSGLTDDELETLWPEWSKTIVAAHTGDQDELNRIGQVVEESIKEAYANGEVKSTRYPDVWDENKTRVKVKERNYWTLGAGLVVGGVLGCVAGPVGMAVGYGIAKAGEIAGREEYVELD